MSSQGWTLTFLLQAHFSSRTLDNLPCPAVLIASMSRWCACHLVFAGSFLLCLGQTPRAGPLPGLPRRWSPRLRLHTLPPRASSLPTAPFSDLPAHAPAQGVDVRGWVDGGGWGWVNKPVCKEHLSQSSWKLVDCTSPFISFSLISEQTGDSQ